MASCGRKGGREGWREGEERKKGKKEASSDLTDLKDWNEADLGDCTSFLV